MEDSKRSQLAKSGGDGQPGGAQRGKEAADQADKHGPDDAANEQLRRYLKCESDLTEALPIYR